MSVETGGAALSAVPAGARLALVVLAVENLGRSRTFYVAAFGWRPTAEAPTYVELELPGSMRLGLYEAAGYARNLGCAVAPGPGKRAGRAELYLEVGDLAACGAAILTAGGALVSAAAVRDWGDEVAYFTDPDGHVLAIARRAA